MYEKWRMLEEMEEDEDVDLARRSKWKTQGKKGPKKSKKKPKEKEFIPRLEKVATTVEPRETLDLTEATKDKEDLMKAYGPLYVLGLDFVVRIPL